MVVSSGTELGDFLPDKSVSNVLRYLGLSSGGASELMEIAFQTKALRTVCLSGEAMDERYGAEAGNLLRRCLADMRAAESLGDLPLLALSPLRDDMSDEAAISVGAGLTITIKANHQKPLRAADGGTDWPRVGRILVHRIQQAHG